MYEDLKVQGTLSPSHTVSLMLQSPDGQVIATLNGTVGLEQPRIIGALTGADRYHGLQVDLRMDRFWNGTDAEVTASVGVTDKGKFDRETLRFWLAVRDRNADEVAQCIRYPLPVTIYQKDQSPRSLAVSDPRTLKRNFDEIFNKYRRDAILNHLPRHLIWGHYSHTVMLGGNVVLFNPKGQVISLP